MNENLEDSPANLEGAEALQCWAPIAFQRIFVDWTGSINAALMLSQLVYWTRRVGWDRWIYKTCDEWFAETGLTKEQQMSARKKMVESGLVEECRKGIPGKIHFRIAKHSFLEKSKLVFQAPQVGKTHGVKTNERSLGKPTCGTLGKPTCNTETTKTKTTTLSPACVAPLGVCEGFVKKAAFKLESFLRVNRKLKDKHTDLPKWEKQIHWLLSKDLDGIESIQRLKRVITLYLKTPHTKYTPRVHNAYSFRNKFFQIEEWVNGFEPPTPKPEYSQIIVKRVVVK